MFTVFVELPSSRRKRATSDTVLAYGYEISLSNDRQSFGESVNIIIYDESCYTCNSTSVTCTILVCFFFFYNIPWLILTNTLKSIQQWCLFNLFLSCSITCVKIRVSVFTIVKLIWFSFITWWHDNVNVYCNIWQKVGETFIWWRWTASGLSDRK